MIVLRPAGMVLRCGRVGEYGGVVDAVEEVESSWQSRVSGCV